MKRMVKKKKSGAATCLKPTTLIKGQPWRHPEYAAITTKYESSSESSTHTEIEVSVLVAKPEPIVID